MREPHRRWADLIGGADRRAAKAVEFCFLLRSFFLVRSAGYPSRRAGLHWLILLCLLVVSVDSPCYVKYITGSVAICLSRSRYCRNPDLSLFVLSLKTQALIMFMACSVQLPEKNTSAE
ncbi:uncharacterized protein BO96DRAFT_193808 [Aspergillus niger CBS 101883]|uniref:uncharacterized protein n=1 Tax=Aspergillus lacticoffeatus (strain CBS 101883) TaxID=1450533 RepID=UPI000D7F38AD|nr:uncharacterized protein BO96DRAFT_193808 [Aspergillus niger CBS 101883]PYH51276.1 hypothetical protein BO96DRAFT_193808 [Aspergillus niger CBS 101883]